MDTLTNKIPAEKVITDNTKNKYLDPTFGKVDYVDRYDAQGPVLAIYILLFDPKEVRVLDLYRVLGSIGGALYRFREGLWVGGDTSRER